MLNHSAVVRARKQIKVVKRDWDNTTTYQVGDRVSFRAIVKHPGYMDPGDELPGTIICAFEAAGQRIYRIRLDKKEKVVGNVYAGQIQPL